MFYDIPENLLLLQNELEEALISNSKTKWDKMLIELFSENESRLPYFEHGFWLTRARKMKDNATIPYCGSDIGMNKVKNDGEACKKNRWGNMFYLSTDMMYRSSFKEVKIPVSSKGTLGYFFITEPLKLFNATKPFVVGTSEKYGGIDENTALFLLLFLIDKWFNKSADKEDDRQNVYQITNKIAKLIRENTNLDGIVYQGTMSNNYSWNIALVDDKKTAWGYSALYVPDKLGRYRITSKAYSEKYGEMISFTEKKLKFYRASSMLKQLRSVFSHRFPQCI